MQHAIRQTNHNVGDRYKSIHRRMNWQKRRTAIHRERSLAKHEYRCAGVLWCGRNENRFEYSPEMVQRYPPGRIVVRTILLTVTMCSNALDPGVHPITADVDAMLSIWTSVGAIETSATSQRQDHEEDLRKFPAFTRKNKRRKTASYLRREIQGSKPSQFQFEIKRNYTPLWRGETPSLSHQFVATWFNDVKMHVTSRA